MTFSFTSPKPKQLVSPITRAWILCFVASFLILIGTQNLLRIQSNYFLQSSKNLQNQITQKQSEQNILNNQLAFLNLQLQKLQEAKQKNTTLTNAIKNLFDLIPEQITINSITLTDQALTIKGITPSKELYVFLLETPLKAIFLESKVDFFVLPSGWYNFVSVSKIDYNAQGPQNAQ